MQQEFKDKVVVITGAAGGIGRATAERLAAQGARLVLVDLPGPSLREVAAGLQATGAQVLAHAADVTRQAEVQAYVDAAVQAFGGIDGFFNNAGVLGRMHPLIAYPEDEFDQVMAVNVKAAWLGIKLVAPVMLRRGGGAIVNTASVAGLRGSAGLVAYSVSKHAVIGLTRVAANELTPQGIRVNAVCPGPIATAMGEQLDRNFSPLDPQAGHERVVSRIPMGRYGTADEVAALVAFLLSGAAGYISGAAYPIDGSMTA